MEDELQGRQSAFDEARALHRMLGDENTVEDLRELIVVPAWTERVLRVYALAFPEDAHWIERTLMFRSTVLEEFNRLVREGVSMTDLPEAEETESEPFTEAMAVVAT